MNYHIDNIFEINGGIFMDPLSPNYISSIIYGLNRVSPDQLTMLAFLSSMRNILLILQMASYSCARDRIKHFPTTAIKIPNTIFITEEPEKMCLTPHCNNDVLANIASEVRNKMDTNVHPCDNFYKFACGGFLKSTNIPANKNLVDNFSIVRDKVHNQIKMSLEEPIKPDEPKRFILAKKLYKACSCAGEVKGENPLLAILKKLGGWPVIEGNKWKTSAFNWIETTYSFNDLGFNANHLLSLEVKEDPENITNRSIYIDQPNSLFGSIQELSRHLNVKGNITQPYINYMVDIAVFFGANRTRAIRDMVNSFNFEIKLAQLFLTAEKRQNFALIHNSMTLSELIKNYPSIPWKKYFRQILSIDVQENETVIVIAPSFIQNLEKLISKTRKRILSDYMMWRIVHDSVQYLNNDIRQRSADFFELLTGKMPNNAQRLKQCQTVIEERLSKSVDALYIRKYFNKETKESVVKMVSNIRSQLIKIIRNLQWMDEETKKSAIEKAKSMSSEIAYSEEFLNGSKIEEFYDDLEIFEDNYLQSILNLKLFERKKKFDQPKETTDTTENSENIPSPTSVGAVYSPLDNTIHVPAGILQDSFFGIERPMYMNYAAIGFIIGHEMTHGFDIQSRNFDSVGKLVDWWAPDANKTYFQKVKCITEQYGNYTVEDVGIKIDGERTQAENFADNGGMISAYWAYRDLSEKIGSEPELPGFSYNNRQMFWISSANSWCRKYRLKTLQNRIEKDTHCPAEFRIIGSLSNIPEFAEDFNCSKGSPMNPLKKCIFW